MSEMIERVAAIIWNYDNSRSFDDLDEASKDGCREVARAAIEAMREPTDDMVNACDINIPTEGMITGVWKDMIDAALDKVDA